MVKRIMLILFFVGYELLHTATAQNCKTAKNDSIEIIFAVESWPDFNKKSTEGLMNFIDENVREVTVPKGNTRVVVQFLVDTLGNTSNHKIIRGVNPELDNEALRVSRLLKFMKPAIQRGNPINFNYTVVFDFEKYSFNKKKAGKDN